MQRMRRRIFSLTSTGILKIKESHQIYNPAVYILKIKGTGKIPDHIQIRDDDFSLMAYFKVTHPKTSLTRCNLLHKLDEIMEIAGYLEYGKIQKLEL